MTPTTHPHYDSKFGDPSGKVSPCLQIFWGKVWSQLRGGESKVENLK